MKYVYLCSIQLYSDSLIHFNSKSLNFFGRKIKNTKLPIKREYLHCSEYEEGVHNNLQGVTSTANRSTYNPFHTLSTWKAGEKREEKIKLFSLLRNKFTFLICLPNTLNCNSFFFTTHKYIYLRNSRSSSRNTNTFKLSKKN